MEQKEITKRLHDIYRSLQHDSIAQAIADTAALIDAAGRYTLREDIDAVNRSYTMLLQYVGQGIDDPERDNVLRHLVTDIYTIADRAAIELAQPLSPEVFYARRRELGATSLQSIVSALRRAMDRERLVAEVPDSDNNAMRAARAAVEQEQVRLFNKLWSTVPLSADERDLTASLLLDAGMSVATRCLIVAALLVGSLKFYDEGKIGLLAQAYIGSDDRMVSLRALTCLLLSMSVHRHRVALAGGGLRARLTALTELTCAADDIAMVQQRLANARNTARLTRHINEDIMGDIVKDRNLTMHIRDGEIAEPNESNPEWQEFIERSGVADKLQELNELQMEGNDVYAGSFAGLKSFPFFKTLANWFRPFSADYSEFAGKQAELVRVIETFEQVGGMCSSDKYSMAFSLGAMPAGALGKMSQAFTLQAEMIEQAREMATRPDFIVGSWVQDLYRFFNMFSRRNEFLQSFDDVLDVRGLPLLEQYTTSDKTLLVLGEFFLRHEFYTDAVSHFTDVLAGKGEHSPMLFQKVGYAYQCAGNYRDAIEYYRRYDLVDDTNLWNTRHLAACYRAMGLHDEALATYRRVLESAPDDIATILNMGHCHVQAGRYTEAMQHYLQVDLMPEGGERAWRPLAWCALLMGNTGRSLDYYDKIVARDDAGAVDHLNRGHALLVAARVPQAFESYRRAVAMFAGGEADFKRQFNDDRKHLIALGKTDIDLSLLLDAVLVKPE